MYRMLTFSLVLLVTLLGGCQTEQGAEKFGVPLDVANNQTLQVTVEEQEEIIQAIVQAEKVLFLPYIGAKEAAPFGQQTLLFPETFRRKSDVYHLYVQYWAPNLAEQLANETIDLSNSREDIGLAAHPYQQRRSILEADPHSIRISHFNAVTAVVDMLIMESEYAYDHRLQYVLMRDPDQDRWRVAAKTLLDYSY